MNALSQGISLSLNLMGWPDKLMNLNLGDFTEDVVTIILPLQILSLFL